MDGPHGGGVSQAHSWPPQGGAWTCDEVVMATAVEAICGPGHGSPYQGTFVLWPLLNSNLSGAETNIESPPVMSRIPLCDQQAT